jgi:N-methylhydantoinase B
VYAVFRSIIGSGIPPNAGMTAPIRVVAPEGTIVNPRFPGAVGARGMLLWRLVDVAFGALAAAAPGRVAAGGEGGIHTMLFSPKRTNGRERGMLFELYSSGWGGRQGGDGIDGVTPIICGGAIRTTPVEIIEREFPVVVEGFGFVPDTGGAGEFRGSVSVFRSWRFLEPGHVQIRSNRVQSLPYGVAGGAPGTPYSVMLQRQGEWRPLPPKMVTEVDVEAGDRLVNVQPGGGGFGEPFCRAAESVFIDVRDGKLSPAMAAEAYGVVIDEVLGHIDREATTQRRLAGSSAQSGRKRGVGNAGNSGNGDADGSPPPSHVSANGGERLPWNT